jgi:hypothetical protein
VAGAFTSGGKLSVKKSIFICSSSKKQSVAFYLKTQTNLKYCQNGTNYTHFHNTTAKIIQSDGNRKQIYSFFVYREIKKLFEFY